MNRPNWHMKNNHTILAHEYESPNLAHGYVMQCYAMRSFTHKPHILLIPQNHQLLVIK